MCAPPSTPRHPPAAPTATVSSPWRWDFGLSLEWCPHHWELRTPLLQWLESPHAWLQPDPEWPRTPTHLMAAHPGWTGHGRKHPVTSLLSGILPTRSIRHSSNQGCSQCAWGTAKQTKRFLNHQNFKNEMRPVRFQQSTFYDSHVLHSDVVLWPPPPWLLRPIPAAWPHRALRLPIFPPLPSAPAGFTPII